MKTAERIVCEHNCLSLATAGAEMKAVAAQNARVKNPVYHVMVSWPANEHPSNDDAFACGAHVLGAVGMTGHQYVFAIHRDTNNVHMHIAVNRVNPETFSAVYPDRDFYKLDKAMRELELRFGWSHDNGSYMVRERNGVSVIEWRTASSETKGHKPTAAADMERHGDQESFISYVRGEPRRALMPLLAKDDLTWQQLHAHLGQYGLALREKGQGLAVYDLHSIDTTPVKASDLHEALSKGRLTKRLGIYEAPALDAAMAAVVTYDKFRPPKRDEDSREAARLQRAELRRGLVERYKRYRAQFSLKRLDSVEVRQRFALLRAEARRRRLLVRTIYTSKADRKAQYSIIAFETLKARERLREDIRTERQQRREAFQDSFLNYRKWVEQLAALGDVAAISQLRGWAYGAQRARAAGRAESPRNLICGDADEDPAAAAICEGVPFRVRRDGAICHGTGRGVIDHGGYIEVVGDVAPDSVSQMALLLAYGRFGSNLRVQGPPEFQQQVHRMMAAWPDQDALQREVAKIRQRVQPAATNHEQHLSDVQQQRESD